MKKERKKENRKKGGKEKEDENKNSQRKKETDGVYETTIRRREVEECVSPFSGDALVSRPARRLIRNKFRVDKRATLVSRHPFY